MKYLVAGPELSGPETIPGADAMLDFWNTRRARKAAVSTILPLVQRTRFVNGEIADDRWLDAYMIGFLTMLITRLATERVHSISTEALGIVQAAAWQDITGLPGELMGEEACLLSAGNHADFCRGCENADILARALTAGKIGNWFGPSVSLVDSNTTGQRSAIDDGDISALWSDHFEQPIFRMSHTSRT